MITEDRLEEPNHPKFRLLAALMAATLFAPPGCDTLDTGPEDLPQEANHVMDFQIIAIHPYPRDMVGVQVKITNTCARHISQAQATCIALDAAGAEIGFARHYVIKSTEGGLAPGASTYFEYVINVKNPQAVQSARVHAENVRFR